MIKKILILLALILALISFVLFPVCDSLKPDGTHMACFYSGILITVIGVLIVLISLTKKFLMLKNIIISILALMCWVIPNRIINISPFGLCADFNHACRASTMPAVGVIVSVIIILCVMDLIFSFVKGEK